MIIGAFPFALYVSLAGGSVSIPMGLCGLDICRMHKRKPGQGTTFVLKTSRFFGRHLGPILDERGYEHTATMDYPLLPAAVDIYKRRP